MQNRLYAHQDRMAYFFTKICVITYTSLIMVSEIMWYIKFLEQLATTICASDASAAVVFINQLMTLVKKEIFGDEDLEPLFVLGLIKDLFKYSKNTKDKDITLAEFAQKCMGLVILHAKSSDDESIYCIDFIDILKDKTIFNALNINKDLAVLRQECLDGKRKSESILPSSELKTVNDYIANRVQLTTYTQNYMLKLFERKSFNDLKYVVKVDLGYSVHVLTVLLNQQKNPYPVLKSLHSFLLPLKDKDKRFDLLIRSVEKEINTMEQSEKSSIRCTLSRVFNQSAVTKRSRSFNSESDNKENHCLKSINVNN
ncbi:DNA repair protein [Legionella quateirensis]|uniref:DNA repair protein n=2 Tax=Legionella quateirensis TaxID=45072 RepID=A0A378KW60_9GAMM|nr:DNA repair protein [Legionella quateirensis]STY17747.1 DNA repair protein [Legionella quateirensis]